MLLTHLHADHYLGLAGLCAWLAEHGRSRPLQLVAPLGWESVLTPLLGTGDRHTFPIDTLTLEGPRLIQGALDTLAFPVQHVGRAFGFALTPPGADGIKIVVSGDTVPCRAVEDIARDATLLVHEATFCTDEEERARETRHSTAAEAAELASRCGVRSLALVHLSSRHPPSLALEEARRAFPAARLPRDLDVALVADHDVRFLHRRPLPPS